jgi:hypothetical protein
MERGFKCVPVKRLELCKCIYVYLVTLVFYSRTGRSIVDFRTFQLLPMCSQIISIIESLYITVVRPKIF